MSRGNNEETTAFSKKIQIKIETSQGIKREGINIKRRTNTKELSNFIIERNRVWPKGSWYDVQKLKGPFPQKPFQFHTGRPQGSVGKFVFSITRTMEGYVRVPRPFQNSITFITVSMSSKYLREDR